jgi:hypothetical protein
MLHAFIAVNREEIIRRCWAKVVTGPIPPPTEAEIDHVGVGGSTGAALHRSLLASRPLISRSLVEVRLTQGVQTREQFLVPGFIEEIASASTLEANARGVRLTA